LHPNKSRAHIRNALDLVPGSWAGDIETVWQIMEIDPLGHSVVEMTRGRHHPKPWPAYSFWIASTDAGVRYAVIGEPSEIRIRDLLASREATHIPPAVGKAKIWLHDYLAEHRETLRNDIIDAAKVAGHSQAAIVRAKAISADTIGHTPQGIGPSKWYLIADPRLVNKLSQLTPHNGSAADPVRNASVIRLADLIPASSKPKA
jgi:hypothetical protein